MEALGPTLWWLIRTVHTSPACVQRPPHHSKTDRSAMRNQLLLESIYHLCGQWEEVWAVSTQSMARGAIPHDFGDNTKRDGPMTATQMTGATCHTATKHVVAAVAETMGRKHKERSLRLN